MLSDWALEKVIPECRQQLQSKDKNHKSAILAVSLSFFLVTDILFLGTKKKGGKKHRNHSVLLEAAKVNLSSSGHHY